MPHLKKRSKKRDKICFTSNDTLEELNSFINRRGTKTKVLKRKTAGMRCIVIT